MINRNLACVLLAVASVPSLARADAGSDAKAHAALSTLIASRLTADAELSRFAIHHASGANVRSFAARILPAINEYAASQHLQVPSPMTDSDRVLVEELERQKGDDFDLAYMWIFKTTTFFGIFGL